MSQKIINTLLQAIQDTPDNPFPHFALAKEYIKIDDRESAGKHFQQLVQHFPDYSGTYYHYAIFLIEQNEKEEAHKIIGKGLSVLQKSGETKLYSELVALRDQFNNL